MVVCCLDRVFRSPFHTYRTVDCISEICACYHYKSPDIALLHLCLCRILKSNSFILIANGFMGSHWHCPNRTKFVFCILLHGQISTMEKGKINIKSTKNFFCRKRIFISAFSYLAFHPSASVPLGGIAFLACGDGGALIVTDKRLLAQFRQITTG